MPCTEEDYSEFYSPRKGQEEAIERMKEKGSLKCFDKTKIDKDKMIIYGNERTSHAVVQIYLAPCNYKVFETDEIHPKCETSLKKQEQYLGDIHIITMYNQRRFLSNKFGEEAILNESVLVN